MSINPSELASKVASEAILESENISDIESLETTDRMMRYCQETAYEKNGNDDPEASRKQDESDGRYVRRVGLHSDPTLSHLAEVRCQCNLICITFMSQAVLHNALGYRLLGSCIMHSFFKLKL